MYHCTPGTADGYTVQYSYNCAAHATQVDEKLQPLDKLTRGSYITRLVRVQTRDSRQVLQDMATKNVDVIVSGGLLSTGRQVGPFGETPYLSGNWIRRRGSRGDLWALDPNTKQGGLMGPLCRRLCMCGRCDEIQGSPIAFMPTGSQSPPDLDLARDANATGSGVGAASR